jgi:hypothetical protein
MNREHEMASLRLQHGVSLAGELLEQPGWEETLTVSVAFAYRKQIICACGDNLYRSVLPFHNQERAQHGLQQLPLNVKVGESSLAFSANSLEKPRWLCFAGQGRWP